MLIKYLRSEVAPRFDKVFMKTIKVKLKVGQKRYGVPKKELLLN